MAARNIRLDPNPMNRVLIGVMNNRIAGLADTPLGNGIIATSRQHILRDFKSVTEKTFSSFSFPKDRTEITREIPYVGDDDLKHLTERGIAKIGSPAETNSILIGRITFKEPANKPPEASVLRAIFGEKAIDYDDISIRNPFHDKSIVYDSFYSYSPFNDRKKIERRLVRQLDEAEIKAQEMAFVSLAFIKPLLPGDILETTTGERGVLIKTVDNLFISDNNEPVMLISPKSDFLGLLQNVEERRLWKISDSFFLAHSTFNNKTELLNLIKDNYLFDENSIVEYLGDMKTGYIDLKRATSLEEDKITSRDIGQYSLIGNQPFIMDSDTGYHYGTSITALGLSPLREFLSITKELLTIKSDDVEGRMKLNEHVIRSGSGSAISLERDFKSLAPKNLQMISLYLKSLGLKLELGEKLSISPASKDEMQSWSYGEVLNPETINIRSGNPERTGLFAQEIFGPIKDFECGCGIYKRVRHKGIICERCGVEVTQSKVRNYRMGHIKLGESLIHPYFHEYLANMLGIPLKDLQNIIYFEKYIIIDPGNTSFERKQIITKDEFEEAEFQDLNFKAGMGAPAIKQILEEEGKETWMCLEILPVLPPGMRPFYPIKNSPGSYFTHDSNHLYRHIINLNNRLFRLKDMGAPDVIITNEIRMLQERVDALLWNGSRGKAIVSFNNNVLRSLTDELISLFQNFTNKTCNYSGRGIVLSNSDLNNDQCSMPYNTLLTLYRPILIGSLIEKGIVQDIKRAKSKIDRDPKAKIIRDTLVDAISSRPLIFIHSNKAVALKPKIQEDIEGVALPNKICEEFGFKIDGEKIDFHLPLTEEAIEEANSFLGRVVIGSSEVENVFSKLVQDNSLSTMIDLIINQRSLPLSELEKSLKVYDPRDDEGPRERFRTQLLKPPSISDYENLK